jgi:hypothetical protein
VRLPSPARNTARAALAGALIASAVATALPLTLDEIAGLCGSGPGPENCARRIESVQLKRLPELAKRDGATLIVSLYPAGTTSFADADVRGGERTYSLYDYVSEINAVVLYVTEGSQSSFVLLQRAGGRRTDLPADPHLSPDRQNLVTADFCAKRCTNEIVLWRVTKDGVHKTHAWRPREQWIDAAATWKDVGTLAIEYTPAGQEKASVMNVRISDADWVRFPPP